MKIKKGKLNYDQSGRAYPNNPRVKENWDCIWEYEGKYYKLVGDNEHKEWDEVNIYNQIIDEVYETYKTIHKHDIRTEADRSQLVIESLEKQLIYPKEEFINKCKVDSKFSEKWELKIEERELSLKEQAHAYNNWLEKQNYNPKHQSKIIDIDKLSESNLMTILQSLPGPTKLITLTYNNETIESYE